MGFTGASIAGATNSIAGFAKTVQPLISVGSQVAGAFGQVRGQDQQYNGAAGAMNYNQGVFEQHAKLLEEAAAQNKATAERQKRSALSSIKANIGARGLDLSGSPLLLMAESAANLELDVQNEEFNSLVDAQRARSQAAVYGVEADNYRSAGRTAKRSTGLSSTFKIASQY